MKRIGKGFYLANDYIDGDYDNGSWFYWEMEKNVVSNKMIEQNLGSCRDKSTFKIYINFNWLRLKSV